MNSIDTIMHMLDCNTSIEVQQEGLRMAREVGCIKAFFQPCGPDYHKNVWDNCARVIAEHSDLELIPYIVDMLIWIQDLNWPGAEIILKRLQEFDNVSMLALIINKTVLALSALDDSVWKSNIASLLYNQKLVEHLSLDSIQSLREAD